MVYDLVRLDVFCTARIRNILLNRTYIGDLRIANKKIAENWTKGKHEPLIDPAIFNIAQERLKAGESRIIRDMTPRNPLSSLVKCSVCGKAMTIQNCKGIYYLKCKGFNCNTVSSMLDKVEAQVIQELTDELKKFKHYLDNQADEDRKKDEARKNEISIITQAIKKKEKALDTCCELLEDGVYTRDQYFKRVKVLKDDIDSLQSSLEHIKASYEDKSESIKSKVPILEKCIENYYSLSVTERNNVLKSMIDRIEYTRISAKKRAPFKLKIFLKI